MSLAQVTTNFRYMLGSASKMVRGLLDLESIMFWIEGRDWQVNFESIEGKKGETKTITIAPQCAFRGEKVLANDSLGGKGTRIGNTLIGQHLQSPAGNSTLTLFFSQNAIGNGVRWRATKPWESIAVNVEFIEDCKFDAVVFGRARV